MLHYFRYWCRSTELCRLQSNDGVARTIVAITQITTVAITSRVLMVMDTSSYRIEVSFDADLIDPHGTIFKRATSRQTGYSWGQSGPGGPGPGIPW
jgi:hypothetical protein